MVAMAMAMAVGTRYVAVVVVTTLSGGGGQVCHGCSLSGGEAAALYPVHR